MTEAQNLTAALGGRWYGRFGSAPCPVCQPEGRSEQNALTLSDGASGLLLHCKKSNCDFRDVLAAAGILSGDYEAPNPAEQMRRKAEDRAEAAKKERQAYNLWRSAHPIAGTPAKSYLRGRGITCSLPESLRFSEGCWHPSAQRFPALIALVEGGDGVAVHRTFLRPDGSGKADVAPSKAMLGSVKGGTVRLFNGPGPLVVAEGIETALSLASGLLVDFGAVWAALSASGMTAVRLPPYPGNLIVACDGDKAGRKAAQSLAQRATACGWNVRHADPGDGRDFNDLLMSEVAA